MAKQVLNGKQIPTGAASKAYVATNETTASTSYTDLATTTDSVTVTIGQTGLALVSLGCYSNVNSNGQICYLSFAISGATTVSAGTPASGTVDLLMQQQSGANGTNYSSYGTVLVTGLTAGSTTFKMKYKVSGGTGSFVQRYISVVPL